MSSLADNFFEFLSTTSAHGYAYVANRERHGGPVRLAWAALSLAALATAAVVSVATLQRWSAEPHVTIIEEYFMPIQVQQ